MTDELEHDDYPHREKAVIPTDTIETPEKPKVIDPHAKPSELSQEFWDTLTLRQKKAQIATFNALKIHAERQR